MEKSGTGSESQNVGSTSVGGGEKGGDSSSSSSSSCGALMYDTSDDAAVAVDVLDSILEEANYDDLDKVTSLLDRGADPNCNDSSVGMHNLHNLPFLPSYH